MPLVLLSFAVALFGSYTALDMGSRLRRATGKSRRFWLIGSAVVLGSGIWSMHFVAMLAFKLGVPVTYDFHLTALSLLIAIAFVAIGFHIVARPNASLLRLIVAGAIVGLGVTAMHYTGMAALILSGRALYDPVLVAASVAIAVVAATAALWLTLNLTNTWQRIAAALVMAFAVCGMHYTAMSATSFLCSPGQLGLSDPHSRTVLAAAVSVAQFMILCLAMVCVFADRRFELLAEREAEGLRRANAALTASQSAIRNLLDHADQGFLTIGPDLLVEEQCSAACRAMLGAEPQGRPIVALLHGEAAGARASDFQATLESVFRDGGGFMRDLKIGLLPTLFRRDGKTIKVAYKYLADSQRLMLILTDITDATLLAEAVERESLRLQMIVLALTEGETFCALVHDYRKFLDEELPMLIRLIASPGMLTDLKRRLHTFKGLLSQFSFSASPRQLHALETEIADGAIPGAQAATRLAAALQRDLDNISDVLGADFTSTGRRITLPHLQIQQMKEAAKDLLAAGPHAPALQSLLQSILRLGGLDVKSALVLNSRGTAALAERLEKQLAPITVEGDDLSLPPERFAEFFRSLVHVFRNAVDHGIEAPEERLAAGKPVEGAIGCVVSAKDDAVAITIADDGRGVDRAALEDKLRRAGATDAKINALTLEDLVFCEGLSARESASEVSGRGVGLAAVKAELENLGGSVSVESRPGKGTSFSFRLPIAPNSSTDNMAKMETLCP